MTPHPPSQHLDAERIQAYLDGELAEGETATVRSHLERCARCRSEADAWSVLYRELDGLGEVAPSRDFASRVMEALPPERLAPVPLRARIREWLGGTLSVAPRRETADGHLGAGALQDLVDGVLSGGPAAAADRHLAACRHCRDELESWRGLMVGLDGLPELAPSPAFRERVLAHVRVQQAATVARPTLAERVRGWLDRVSPRTRRRLAAVAGMAVTPAVTVALVAWTVFSHPLVTPASLASFLWLKGRAALETAGSALAGHFTDQAVLVETFGVVAQLAQTPLAAAGTLLLLALATSAAAWVLYQNLILHRATGGPHVQLLS